MLRDSEGLAEILLFTVVSLDPAVSVPLSSQQTVLILIKITTDLTLPVFLSPGLDLPPRWQNAERQGLGTGSGWSV